MEKVKYFNADGTERIEELPEPNATAPVEKPVTQPHPWFGLLFTAMICGTVIAVAIIMNH